MKKRHSLFKKGDIILAAVIVVVCAAAIFMKLASRGELFADIYVDGELKHEIDLTQVTDSYKITVRGIVIEIDKNRIRYLEADCPDRLCTGYGWLTRAGEVMACVPNKTVISLRNSRSAKLPHAVTY